MSQTNAKTRQKCIEKISLTHALHPELEDIPIMKQKSKAELPFFRHGFNPKCDPEIAHTIVELVDVVGSEFRNSKWHWDDFQAGIDRKRKKDYRAQVEPSRLKEAWQLLRKKTWLSLHNTNAEKKISDISPLEGLSDIRQLFLAGNIIQSIAVLKGFKHLKELDLGSNRIADITPLASCKDLEELSLGNNPIKDLRVLEKLPRLRELTVSTNQMKAFNQCKCLPSLRELRISGETKIKGLNKSPEMPALRILSIGGVVSVAGIERYPTLVNVDLKAKEGYPLDPIAGLPELTCITAYAWAGLLDATPLAHCSKLRQITLRSDYITGLNALLNLKHLHLVPLDKDRSEFNRRTAKKLQAKVTPWDVEFLAAKPKARPSSKIVTVSETEFNHHDKNPYGLNPDFEDKSMLWWEREWLVGRIETDLQKRLKKEDDFVIPVKNYGARSHALVLYSLKAYKLAPWIIKTVQRHLCRTNKDWIIYFQSLLDEGVDADKLPEGTEDFIVWIHPDRIAATADARKVIVPLLK